VFELGRAEAPLEEQAEAVFEEVGASSDTTLHAHGAIDLHIFFTISGH
jgi:hypothetical protein